MTITSVDTDHDGLAVTFTAEFPAAAEAVWELWADPRKLEQWWGPPGYPATFRNRELGAGGVVEYFMTGPEGERHAGLWRVRTVEAPSLLEFDDVFADADWEPVPGMPVTQVRVLLEERDGGTRMVMRTRFESRDQLEKWLATDTLVGTQRAIEQMDALLA